MALNQSSAVECSMCNTVVVAVDVQARSDPRVHRQWEGQALLCWRCALSLDRDLRNVGRRSC